MFDVEILALARLFGYRVKEVPIRWRDDGDGRLQLLSGNLRNVRDIFRIRFLRPRNCRGKLQAPGRTMKVFVTRTGSRRIYRQQPRDRLLAEGHQVVGCDNFLDRPGAFF